MTAQLIFDLVPIGAIVAWSDGTPRPSERHTKRKPLEYLVVEESF